MVEINIRSKVYDIGKISYEISISLNGAYIDSLPWETDWPKRWGGPANDDILLAPYVAVFLKLLERHIEAAPIIITSDSKCVLLALRDKDTSLIKSGAVYEVCMNLMSKFKDLQFVYVDKSFGEAESEEMKLKLKSN